MVLSSPSGRGTWANVNATRTYVFFFFFGGVGGGQNAEFCINILIRVVITLINHRTAIMHQTLITKIYEQ